MLGRGTGGLRPAINGAHLLVCPISLFLIVNSYSREKRVKCELVAGRKDLCVACMKLGDDCDFDDRKQYQKRQRAKLGLAPLMQVKPMAAQPYAEPPRVHYVQDGRRKERERIQFSGPYPTRTARPGRLWTIADETPLAQPTSYPSPLSPPRATSTRSIYTSVDPVGGFAPAASIARAVRSPGDEYVTTYCIVYFLTYLRLLSLVADY